MLHSLLMTSCFCSARRSETEANIGEGSRKGAGLDTFYFFGFGGYDPVLGRTLEVLDLLESVEALLRSAESRSENFHSGKRR